MNKMRRVSREHRCPACNHDTWCLLGDKGYICMRMQSNIQKTFKGGEIGWFHTYNGELPKLPQPFREAPSINARKLLKEWSAPWNRKRMPDLAGKLGVSIESLEALECTHSPWSHAWGFPMKDGYGNYIGIRIRHEDGKKWAQPGSQAGIFIPKLPVPRRILVVEGPTDTAAALTFGYYAIGRPSCSGGVHHIMAFVRRCHVHEVVIVADNDDPGIRGGNDLQRMLPVASCLLLLPTKDLREFLRIGDRSTIDAMIDQLVWTQPRAAA